MNRLSCAAISLLLASSLAFGLPAVALAKAGSDEDQEEGTSNAKPDAGGVVIDPSSGKIAEGDQITITFPLAMVAPDLIAAGNQPSPVARERRLAGPF